MSNIAVRATNLSKAYRIGLEESNHETMVDAVISWVKSPFTNFQELRKLSKFDSEDEKDVVWAARDISFEIEHGDAVGVIGRNGAGKSTLLKILSRITEPTRGRAEVFGRIGSLLEVGTGFHPDLTGRENIYLNGTILGMKKREVDLKFDEIVDFSGVEKFIDTPVKRYSSGMRVRLGFSVAAHLEPEILIIDEVLAVGDAEFQKKCLGKMGQVTRGGRTVLFVSHNMHAIRSLCNRGILLEAGAVAFAGACEECVERYESLSLNEVRSEWTRSNQAAEGPLTFESASCKLLGRQPHLSLRVEFTLRSRRTHQPAFLAVDILESGGSCLMQAIPRLDPFIGHGSTTHNMAVVIDLPPLIPGVYGLSLWTGPRNTETFDTVEGCARFEVTDSPSAGRTFPHHRNQGMIVPLSKLEPSQNDEAIHKSEVVSNLTI